MSTAYCVVLTTAGSQEEAEKIAEHLVSHHLAACVQLAHIQSVYAWKGKITRGGEVLLLIKTGARLYPEVEAALREIHSYEIPEIVQLPVEGGFDRYLAWMGENIKADGAPQGG